MLEVLLWKRFTLGPYAQDALQPPLIAFVGTPTSSSKSYMRYMEKKSHKRDKQKTVPTLCLTKRQGEAPTASNHEKRLCTLTLCAGLQGGRRWRDR